MITEADLATQRLIDNGFEPGALEELAAEIARGLGDLGYGPLPRLSHVVPEPSYRGWSVITVHVQLTPSLVLPVNVSEEEYGSSPRVVVEVVRRIWPHLSAIEQAAEDELIALEACLDEVGAGLADMHLRGVALAPIDVWNDIDLPCLAPEVDVIGDNLRREARTMNYTACEDIHHFFSRLVVGQQRLVRLRQLFAERRQTGLVDQMTASAIRGLPDRDRTLRELGRHERVWPTDGLLLRWDEGRVRSYGDGYQGLTWTGDLLKFNGASLPESTLAAVVGKSVTHVCDHYLLDDTMIVERAWNAASADGSDTTLMVELVSVEYLFSGPRATIETDAFDVPGASGVNGPAR